MEIDTGQLTALREEVGDLGRQVDAMGAEMDRLREMAFTLRTLEDARLRRAGMLPAAPAPWPRHLHSLDGGQA